MKWRWSKLLGTFIALLVLTACQIQGNKGSTDDADSGLFELKGQQLTDVKRICDALQLKRHFLFEVADKEKRAQLNVRKRDCGDTQEYDLGNFDADVRIVAGLAPYLEATTARSRYLQEIVSDNNGDIAYFCESAYTNEPKTKIELADKTMELQVVFEGRYDKYIIKKTWANSPIPGFYEIEEGIVHTSRTDQNEDLRGILKQRIFRKPCSVGPEEYFIQTFLQLL
jgi:hypothetical protein